MIRPVEPGTPEWDDLVAEAKRRASDYNWWLGDTALRIVPMGDDHAKSGALSNLRLFGEQIDVSYDVLRICRDVAHAWPDPTRVGSTSWTVHRELMAHQHLIQPGMKARQARELLGRPGPSYDPPPIEPREKARAVRSMLQDPDVLAEFEAEAIANGGRIPSLDEVNERARQTGFIAEHFSAADRFTKLMQRLDAALDEVVAAGPWGENTPEAREIQKRNLRLLDTIVSVSAGQAVDR